MGLCGAIIVLCDLVYVLVASASTDKKHVNTNRGRRAELFGAGDRLGNRHGSLRIAALPFSLLDFSSALILSCMRPVGSLRAVLQKFNSRSGDCGIGVQGWRGP